MFYSKLEKAILKLKNLFVFIVKKNADFVDILTAPYEMSAILVNCNFNCNSEWFEFKIKRVFNIIMNEMNRYGIKYCTLADSSFFYVK